MPILLIILFVLINIPLFYQLDPDFGWHIFLGQKMVEEKSLISNFVGYNYFEKLLIIDHEWLSDILLYLGHKYIGYSFLIIVAVLINLLTFFVLYKLAIKFKIKKEYILLSFAPLFLIYPPVNGIRLQLLLLLAAAILLYIHKIFSPFKKRVILYLLVFILGMNLHGGFLVLGIIPFLLEASFLDKFSFSQAKKDLPKLSLILLVTLIPVFISPYGFRFLSLINDYFGDSFYKTHITEWLPLFSPPITIEFVLHLSVVLFVFTINSFWRKIPKNELVLLLIFLFLSLRYRRFYPLFAITTTTYLALGTEDFFTTLKIKSSKKVFFTLFAFSFLLLIDRTDFDLLMKKSVESSYPKDAVDYLMFNPPQRGNLLNDYNWGGYIKWKIPNQKVFIDGRGPQAKTANGKTLLENYYGFFADEETIADQLNEYDISLVILSSYDDEKTGMIEKTFYKITGLKQRKLATPNLRNFLVSNSEWSKVYQDNQAVIYSKVK